MPSLREMRRRRALSRVELAKRVGLTPQAISQYESSRRVPDYAICRKLGKELGVPWSIVHETAWRAKRKRAEIEAQVADLRDRLEAVAESAKGNDDMRALMASIAADAFGDVLNVEVEE